MNCWVIGWNLKGKFDIAQAYSDSLKQYEKSKPPLEDLSRLIHQIALFLNLIARFDAAEPLIRKAIKIDKKNLGKDHPNVATALNNLASLLMEMKRFSEAEPLIRRALAIYERSFGKDWVFEIAIYSRVIWYRGCKPLSHSFKLIFIYNRKY